MIFNIVDRNNNMNVVRYYLCLCILMNHFNILTGLQLPQLPRIFGGVGSFFAISGFLMFSSYEKHHNLKGYFVRRAKRILPPYFFIVLLAAFGLCLVSTLTPSEYFSSQKFIKYLLLNLGFLNFLAPDLPGVFDASTNIMQAVNGSLWTMKGEVICYLSVPLIYKLIKSHSRHATYIIAGMMMICFIVFLTINLKDGGQSSIMLVIAKQFRVFTFFFAGALINLHLPYFKKYKWFIFAGILIFMGIAETGYWQYQSIRPFTDSALVIWCSIVGKWGHWLSKYNSVSYPMYLYHFPIIQLFITLGIINWAGPYMSLVLVILATITLAAITWFMIDKPILIGPKKYYSEIARNI